MAWIYLIVAGISEIGWPLGLKMAVKGNSYLIGGVILAVVSISFSGFFLYLATREIPIGTAYAVWTSIGAMGTFFVGVLFFGDPSSMLRYVGIVLILLGVISLKLAS